jgi:enoyl-CoA hydratase
LQNVLIEQRGRVARVTVNRPDKLNALNVATRNDLVTAFEELGRDTEVRVVVITGAGDKAFVAGADINEFAGMTAVGQRAAMKRGPFDAVEQCPKPVIAMINDLALACSKSKFGQPEIKLGIIPGGGGTQRLTRLVGEGRTMELILTGDMIGAAEAERIGLVNYVVAPEERKQDRRDEPHRARHGKAGRKEPRAAGPPSGA